MSKQSRRRARRAKKQFLPAKDSVKRLSPAKDGKRSGTRKPHSTLLIKKAMQVLRDNGKFTVVEIAKVFNIAPGTVHRNTTNPEKSGVSPDRTGLGGPAVKSNVTEASEKDRRGRQPVVSAENILRIRKDRQNTLLNATEFDAYWARELGISEITVLRVRLGKGKCYSANPFETQIVMTDLNPGSQEYLDLGKKVAQMVKDLY